ncbi:3904_t:CDS:10 [Paraglomus brasilianum]|uniref:[acyl-carrier-protein] S-malonyltransferase n=1 Tax=Paraglomus brasilianum TaxID=144538 RepID=A0A9N9FK61_9GLOM|nr:3904_t:CDS:10 [Paraglomus brasilianum]
MKFYNLNSFGKFIPTHNLHSMSSAFCKAPVRTWMSTAGIEKSHCAIVFPGQGAQYVGMGKDLYATFASARKVFDEADDALGGGLKKLAFEGQQEKLKLTENAQPAILTTSMAILRVLEEEFGFDIGSACSYALGHSLGEYSALVATKSLSLYDAVKLVRLRGESIAKAVAQHKVSTAISALVVSGNNLDKLEELMEEIRANLPEGELVELANINSSFQVVISGTTRGVDDASRILQSKQIAARAVDLPVSAPFHCVLMQPAADLMADALRETKFGQPIVPIISNVTAKPITSTAEIPSLLVQQITATVQWQKSIKYCKERDIDSFIAFGPGKVLANLLRKEYPMDHVR